MSTVRPDISARAVACLAVPSLALQCELVDRGGLSGCPVALADEAHSRVADATPEARQQGIRRGLTLREAVALCPTLTVLEPRPARVAVYAESLVAALGAISPLLEEAEPGIVLADLRGTEGMYPRIEDLQQAIVSGLPDHLHPRLGIAGYRFTAIVAAFRAGPSEVVYVPTDAAAAFLAPEPASRLPLPAEAIERLRLLGIDTCGEFAALPRHAVEAQFGFSGGVAWDAARGADPRPLHPRPWARERVVEQMQADPPLISREAILHGLEQMLGRALRHPRAHHRFVRSLRLKAETERGGLWEREQVLREPLGDRSRLWTTIRSLVEYAEFPGPFSMVSLELGGLTEESGRQRSLFDADRVRRADQLDDMVRHLKVRFGESPITRVVEVEPWHRLPERRYGLLEYDP